MKPTSVLILITKSNWGGAQRYVYDLATRLPKDAFAVEVMAGGEGPLVTKLMEAGIPAHGNLPVKNKPNIVENIKAVQKLYSMIRAKRPEVLHLNSSQIGVVGALAGRLAGVKNVVFTAHGWAFNEDRPLAQRMLFKFVYWIALILCHKVITVSEAAKKQVIGWPFIKDKMVVVHNGIDKETGFAKKNARLELVRANEPLKKAVEGVSESNLIWVGTVAELHPIKGYPYAIHAIKECVDELKRTDPSKKVIYTIFGEGRQREYLQSIIVKLSLTENVFLMGHVSGVAQLIKAFDIFLLASLSEGLGYVLLEAGAAALPVVATAVGGIPEVIGDMESGILVQSRTSRELSHALLFMVEHPDDRRKYAAALKEKVTNKFSLETMVKKTSEVYTKKA